MDKQLIRKYINRQYCTPEEVKKMQHWLANAGTDEEVTALLKTSWERNLQVVNADGKRKENVFDQLLLKMEEAAFLKEGEQEQTVNLTARQTWYRHYWWKIAVAVVLVSSIWAVYFGYHQHQVAGDQPTVIYKTTARGQKSTITLRDGSKVHLNSESSVSYLADYGRQTREVMLQGEAFFEVEEDPERPFIVRSGKLTTTALGTSFNVRAFAEEETVSVSLATGKVKVESDLGFQHSERDYILEPGEEAVVHGETFTKQPFDISRILSWKDGIIHFEEATLEETLSTLERWYDVHITVNNRQAAGDIRGTGRFDNQNLENVLRILGHSMKFDFQIKERNVTLKFQP